MIIDVFESPYQCQTKACFWFQEMKQAICDIADKKIDINDIPELTLSENYFNAASKSRAKEIALFVVRRLNYADDAFYSFFIDQATEQQKLLVLS